MLDLEGIWSEYGQTMMKVWATFFKPMILNYQVSSCFLHLSDLSGTISREVCNSLMFWASEAGGLRPGGGPSTLGSSDAGDHDSSEVDRFEAWRSLEIHGPWMSSSQWLANGWFMEVSYGVSMCLPDFNQYRTNDETLCDMVCQTDPSVFPKASQLAWRRQGCDESRVPGGETACAKPVWLGQGSLWAALG